MFSLRAHAAITAGIMAAIVVLATIGNALEGAGILDTNPHIRLASIIIFFGLSIALAFSAVPLMVKLVLGFQVGIGNAASPTVSRFIARERLIVFTLWTLIALGLAVAIPAAIVAGAFD